MTTVISIGGKAKASFHPKINLAEIDKTNGFTARVKRLKQVYLDAVSLVSSDRGYAYMESWKETEGEHEAVRVAKMFRRWAETTRISIREDELIMGGITHMPRGTNPRVETEPVPLLSRLKEQHERLATISLAVAAKIEKYDLLRLEEACQYFKDYFETLATRKKNQEFIAMYNIRGSEKAFLRAGHTPILDDWEKAHSTAFMGMACQPDSEGQVRGLPQPVLVLGCDYEKVLRVGFNGLIKECEDKIAAIYAKPGKERTPADMDAIEVLKSFIIALEGMITYSRRHAALAREMAATEANPQRKKELLTIADVCERVPANPARGFQDALQVQWLVLVGQELEKNSSNALIGRFDQYCYPYYAKDIEEGRLTRQEAAELMGCMFIKWQSLESFTHWGFQRLVPGSYLANVNVGGTDKHGKDASNELSCLLLHVAKEVKTNQPHVSLQYHPAMAPELMQKALECTRDHGAGIPAWFSHKVMMEYLLDRGIPIEEARHNGVFLGCVNIGVQDGYLWDRPGGPSFLNHAKLLELALNNGVDPFTHFKLGPATGDATKFTTIEELEEAYRQQIVAFIDYSLQKFDGLTKEKYFEGTAYSPFTSPLNDDCIGRAKDLHKGGMHYYDELCGGVWIDRSQSDATDSLLALKKVVFDDKEATMAEVLEALKANFVGYDKLKAKLKAAPKFGNDDDEVDTYHAKWWDYTVELSKSRLNFMGNRMAPHRQGAGWAALNGRVTNALPNGRLAGTPLSDAAASPCQGADVKGPTAVLNSVAKLDPDFCEAPLLNMRFTPGPLQNKEGLRKFGELIKAYFDQGSAHVQFTILDRALLLDAQAHPENYRNLVVRVAGYSAFWVELTPGVQEDIIARTQHTI
jgi:pyruvate-formate lyase